MRRAGSTNGLTHLRASPEPSRCGECWAPLSATEVRHPTSHRCAYKKLTKAERESMASADRFDVFYARADVAQRLRHAGLSTRHNRHKDLSVLTELGKKTLALNEKRRT